MTTTLGDTPSTVTRDPAVLLALADRVETGESGREIEGEVLSQFGWRQQPSGWWVNPKGKMSALPRISRSLDAIAAFTEAELPGRYRLRVGRKSDCWAAWFIDTDRDGSLTVTCEAPTEPAARLSAVLRALASEAGRG